MSLVGQVVSTRGRAGGGLSLVYNLTEVVRSSASHTSLRAHGLAVLMVCQLPSYVDTGADGQDVADSTACGNV